MTIEEAAGDGFERDDYGRGGGGGGRGGYR